MAKWERDPRLRQRLAWLLAAAETAAISLNFYFIFAAYMHRLLVAVAPGVAGSPPTVWVTYAATAICFALAAAQGRLYVRGREWVRTAMLLENVVLVVLGVAWFLRSVRGRAQPEPYALYCGLLLPLVTLFPLLWPLLSFRPAPPAASQGG
ncbi:MAG: hypothetical protein FJ288_01995 [Planctomycetes bacterium]|nr:hypothetical protein [Planctomycetota bacterium]